MKKHDASERLLCFKDYFALDNFSELLPCFTPPITISSERTPCHHLISNSFLFSNSDLHRAIFAMCKKAACDSCSTSFSLLLSSSALVYHSRVSYDGPVTLLHTRPPGGAAENTSQVSCPTFPLSNGAHADRESNKQATSTHRWGRWYRRDCRAFCGRERPKGAMGRDEEDAYLGQGTRSLSFFSVMTLTTRVHDIPQ